MECHRWAYALILFSVLAARLVVAVSNHRPREGVSAYECRLQAVERRESMKFRTCGFYLRVDPTLHHLRPRNRRSSFLGHGPSRRHVRTTRPYWYDDRCSCCADDRLFASVGKKGADDLVVDRSRRAALCLRLNSPGHGLDRIGMPRSADRRHREPDIVRRNYVNSPARPPRSPPKKRLNRTSFRTEGFIVTRTRTT